MLLPRVDGCVKLFLSTAVHDCQQESVRWNSEPSEWVAWWEGLSEGCESGRKLTVTPERGMARDRAGSVSFLSPGQWITG